MRKIILILSIISFINVTPASAINAQKPSNTITSTIKKGITGTKKMLLKSFSFAKTSASNVANKIVSTFTHHKTDTETSEDMDEKGEKYLLVSTGNSKENVYTNKKDISNDPNNKTNYVNKSGVVNSIERVYNVGHKDYVIDSLGEADNWTKEKDINKSFNDEYEKSAKERDNKRDIVENFADAKQFDYSANVKVTKQYIKLITTAYAYIFGVKMPFRIYPDPYGVYVGVADYKGASERILISEKLEQYFNGVEEQHRATTSQIEKQIEKSFNLFRLANGREHTGDNKDNLDKKGRNANKLYSRGDNNTKELFTNYSHDKDDFYKTKLDDKRYDDFLDSVKRLKSLVVDEQRQYDDLINNAKQQMLFKKALEYYGMLNAPTSEKGSNLFGNTFEDGKAKTVENSLKYLISFRTQELEKLNRYLNNGTRRANLVYNALDNVEKLALKGIKKDEVPQLKRILQSINFIVNQSQQVFNTVAQNQLGHARYNELQRLVLANQNEKLQKLIDDIQDDTINVKGLKREVISTVNELKGDYKGYRTPKYAKNSN